MSGRAILTVLGKGRGFPETGPLPVWGPLMFDLEVPWRWWVCHLDACALQGACDEAPGVLEEGSSAAWDLAGSGRFTHVLKGSVLHLWLHCPRFCHIP